MGWPPRKRDYPIAILIPSSVLCESPTLREKTIKIGNIVRAASIFRADELAIYDDSSGEYDDDVKVFMDVASYMLTPPYLKKLIHERKRTLQYVGLLPPLNIPSHPAEPSDLTVVFRDSVVIKTLEQGAIVEAGLPKPIFVKGLKAKEGSKVLLRVKARNGRYLAKPVRKTPYYWGLNLRFVKDLGLYLDYLKAKEYSLIGTSRKGTPILREMPRLRRLLKRKPAALVFGSPKEGIYEIMDRLDLDPEKRLDIIVNFIPSQGVRTVRTEEALYIILGIVNLFSMGK